MASGEAMSGPGGHNGVEDVVGFGGTGELAGFGPSRNVHVVEIGSQQFGTLVVAGVLALGVEHGAATGERPEREFGVGFDDATLIVRGKRAVDLGDFGVDGEALLRDAFAGDGPREFKGVPVR